MKGVREVQRVRARRRPPGSPAEFNVESVRKDFPILSRKINGKPLVYLDNAATSQKPVAVIAAERRFYEETNANIHRGVYALSVEATNAYEGARDKVMRFINAAERAEIIFVRGATEAINLVAQSFARPQVGPGDEILISAMEHHSNIVPWQLVRDQTGVALRVIPMSERGELLIEEYQRLLGPRTKLVALTHLSNSIGTINPIREMIQMAHQAGAPVLVDGAQAVAHLPVDMQALECDFYAFSGHKLYAPTGIGALYARRALLEGMPPYQGGGDMIRSVTFEKTTYNDLPHRFEAGTPNIAGAVGLGAAIDYITAIGMTPITLYNAMLLQYAHDVLSEIPGLRIVGTARRKASVVSFVFDDIHPHDLGTVLDHEGLAVRTGHHCAQPVMDFFRVPATTRASMTFYNTREEIDALVEGLQRAIRLFR